MDERLKKRLVGATVLASLVVIFVPMLLEDEPMVETGIQKTNIPPKPERDFSSRVIPAEDEKLSIPPISHRPEIVPLKPPPPPAPVVVEKPEPPAPPSTPSHSAEQPEATPPAVAPREGLTAWVIQVGSFSNRENAEKLVQQIREMKYAAFMEQADVDGKALYRVKVGPEVDRKLADKMLIKLNKDLKSLNLKGAVKSYP